MVRQAYPPLDDAPRKSACTSSGLSTSGYQFNDEVLVAIFARCIVTMLLIDGAIRHVSSKANKRGSQNRDKQSKNAGLNNLNEIENELEANGGFGRHSFAGAGSGGSSMPNMQIAWATGVCQT